jgi:hypothetical protein
MTYERYICPVCKAECANPDELRDHKLKKHKNLEQKTDVKGQCS